MWENEKEMKETERKCQKIWENERKWKKMKENERKWKKMKENERTMKENERKWKKIKENERKFEMDGLDLEADCTWPLGRSMDSGLWEDYVGYFCGATFPNVKNNTSLSAFGALKLINALTFPNVKNNPSGFAFRGAKRKGLRSKP